MNSFSIADELDQAVSNVLAGVETASVNTDLEMGDLVGIVSELYDLPEPAFKAQLKAQLTGHLVTESATWPTPQIKVTSRVEEVPTVILPSLFRATTDGYPLHQRSMAASLFMHVTVLTLVVVAGVFAGHHSEIKPKVTAQLISLADYPLPPAEDVSRGGGSGGTHDKLKASQGAPPRFAEQQLTPPLVIVQNPHPVLPTDSTVIGPPEVVFPKVQIGDLYSKLLVPSNGVGYGGGVGDNHGTGVGNGDGAGVGPGYLAGIGGGIYGKGGGVTVPRPIYDPEPEYSNEARIAKFQGDVVLWVIVGADGIPHDVRVQRSLGMGLDEKAIAAVKNWRFQPATKDGHPVAVQVSIQVNFRLF
jgi:TonB family protein